MINLKKEHMALVFENGILGFYRDTDADSLFCVIANGDNNYLKFGIVENSLLVIDKNQPFEKDKLNVFQTNKIVNGEKQLKISFSQLDSFPYVGQIVMTANQYS